MDESADARSDNAEVLTAPRIRVSMVIRDAANQVLLVEHDKAGRRHWLLPGGGVEPGETMVDAAVREVGEETGLQVTVGRLVVVAEVIEPGGRHLLDLVFLGELAGGELQGGLDGAIVDLAWHDPETLPVLSLHPPIGTQLLAAIHEDFAGSVRVLGNVWTPDV